MQPIKLPEHQAYDDDIIYLTPEAWDRLTEKERLIAEQIRIADEYEASVPERNWRMYE